ncbi:hypothetical protein BDQ12DRAFT_692507 [Crucibulum laeve]|uniref:Uncharacterized protein n=1 Tax=Crucibulum laeve TaxID=68775 RepID=A0A5C3LI33_9AGAR|nr:hypothetical protein BDQ12DRAFT_692507 [Crucibulum laeve]
MKFFSTVVLSVTIFVAAVAASPAPGGFPPQCKPLLQSCAVNGECCGDLCLLGLCA